VLRKPTLDEEAKVRSGSFLVVVTVSGGTTGLINSEELTLYCPLISNFRANEGVKDLHKAQKEDSLWRLAGRPISLFAQSNPLLSHRPMRQDHHRPSFFRSGAPHDRTNSLAHVFRS
jgi:hypothetical protein